MTSVPADKLSGGSGRGVVSGCEWAVRVCCVVRGYVVSEDVVRGRVLCSVVGVSGHGAVGCYRSFHEKGGAQGNEHHLGNVLCERRRVSEGI